MYSVESYMVINVITTVVIFLVLNLYNRVWSYASINEMLAILGATMLSTVFQAFGFSLLYLQVPRSYYFFYFILLSITTIITRFSYRILHTMENGLKKSTRHSRNTIVIGAGEAGNMIIKELKSSKYLNQKVVCVIAVSYTHLDVYKRQASAYAISDTSNAYKKINGVCYNSQGEPVEGAIGKVIDVSENNQDIDWEKVKKSDIDFAILRVGYGNDVSYQDDKKWQYNVSECTRLGIPFGVYIYSYAENTTEAESEADHVLRLIKGYNLAYPVYYDLEDNSQVSLGNATIQKFAETFCNKISNAGYQVGVYANLNWWNNYLTRCV